MSELLILDNRDSFVFNLQHRFHEVGFASTVVRSDTIDVVEIRRRKPAALILSPGPGHPRDAGISVRAIRELSGEIPILGVCLGHQAIGAAFGVRVTPDGAPCHGRATRIGHDGHRLFDGIPRQFDAARYHALALVEPLPDVLEVIARGDDLVMAVAHRSDLTFGVQFHPESILSPHGLRLLANFAECCAL